MDTANPPLPSDLLGWAAALLTLMTFVCHDMRRLRLLALAANAAFIAYGALAQLLPVLALHMALVPVNLWRLKQTLQSARRRDDSALLITAPTPARSHAGRPRRGWTPRRRRRGNTPQTVSGGVCGRSKGRPDHALILAFADRREARQ